MSALQRRGALGSTLIVGANSLIGSALERDLTRSGAQVAGTTRRDDSENARRLRLDLGQPFDPNRLPDSVGVAVICAGVTRQHVCDEQPEYAAAVNITATTALATELVRRGAFVIFLSSNAVFDGNKASEEEQATPTPVTTYGRHKAQVEANILEAGEQVSVVRLTKVLDSQNRLFREWRQALVANQPVSARTDLRFSPVPLSFVVSVLRTVIDRRLPGILQVSAIGDCTYAEAASIGASALGVSTDLVHAATGPPEAHVGRHATLSTRRLLKECGLQPPVVESTIRAVFLEPLSLDERH
jgi:dTDP-4-dehydrorhamnose reductase